MSQVLEIDDLYCGSFAATRTRLVGTRQNGNRTVFIFDDSQGKATEAALDFVNGPTTNLREYLSCLKESPRCCLHCPQITRN